MYQRPYKTLLRDYSDNNLSNYWKKTTGFRKFKYNIFKQLVRQTTWRLLASSAGRALTWFHRIADGWAPISIVGSTQLFLRGYPRKATKNAEFSLKRYQENAKSQTKLQFCEYIVDMSGHILIIEERRYPAPVCRYPALTNTLWPEGVHPGAAISDPEKTCAAGLG